MTEARVPGAADPGAGTAPWRWPDDGRRPVVLTWPATTRTGWGLTATHLALQWRRDPAIRPLLAGGVGSFQIDPPRRIAVERTLGEARALRAHVEANPRTETRVEATVLQIAGNRLGPTTLIRGRRTILLPIVENTAGTAAKRAFLAGPDRLVAASRWNAAVLEAIGGRPLDLVHQGIDPVVHHPAPRRGLFPGRFVVFSGGKLEYRKGQDIVVAAFRAFRARHPDALLLAAWHNDMAEAGADLAAGPHLPAPPRRADGAPDIARWLAEAGLPAHAYAVLGPAPHAAMALAMREADVALFANRAEGGTNLVAMEALALGLPTILSANTGHLDLLAAAASDPAAGHAVALARQGPCRPPRAGFGVEGWGESDVEEVVAALERVRADGDGARAMAAAGAAAFAGWTWARTAARLGDIVHAVG